jgi:hypothetical protein
LLYLVSSSSCTSGENAERKQQKKRLEHPNEVEMDASSQGLKHFIGTRWRAETDGSSAPVEAESTSVHIVPRPPVELDGTHAKERG